MTQEERQNRIIGYRIYTRVWVALMILLFVTIAVTRMHLLANYSVLAAVVIASIKAALVLAFFMHLKYEGKLLKGMLALTLSAVTVTIALTFVDVWYR